MSTKYSKKSEKLSPFQREKLEYYYRFLVGHLQEGSLDADSMTRFNERILDFTGWYDNSTEAKECKEVHNTFYEILLDRVREAEGEHTDCVQLTSWLSLFSSMLTGVMGMHNLPIYIRLLPRVLFKMIDRRGEGLLYANDLAIFYRDMVHLDPAQAEETARKAFDQMTDGGRYPLNADGYEQLFANFLIGRTPHGPGRYIFGCFEHEVRPFQLIQPMPDPDAEDSVHPVKHLYSRRPSKQLIVF